MQQRNGDADLETKQNHTRQTHSRSVSRGEGNSAIKYAPFLPTSGKNMRSAVLSNNCYNYVRFYHGLRWKRTRVALRVIQSSQPATRAFQNQCPYAFFYNELYTHTWYAYHLNKPCQMWEVVQCQMWIEYPGRCFWRAHANAVVAQYTINHVLHTHE
jgi:hypothetical protein